MIFLLLLGIVGIGVLSLFAFPKLSPIPYFPSNKKDLEMILKMLGLKNNQTIIDLGAGDGWVIFEAAKRAQNKNLNTQFIAVEINPILYIVLLLKHLFHRNKKNIKIFRADMFTLNHKNLYPKVKSDIVYYLYISPWLLEKTITTIKQYNKKFSIISYMYPISERIPIAQKKGLHKLFKYNYA